MPYSNDPKIRAWQHWHDATPEKEYVYSDVLLNHDRKLERNRIIAQVVCWVFVIGMFSAAVYTVCM